MTKEEFNAYFAQLGLVETQGDLTIVLLIAEGNAEEDDTSLLWALREYAARRHKALAAKGEMDRSLEHAYQQGKVSRGTFVANVLAGQYKTGHPSTPEELVDMGEEFYDVQHDAMEAAIRPDDRQSCHIYSAEEARAQAIEAQEVKP